MSLDYQKIFEQQPANFVVFRANDPDYHIVATTDSHLKTVGMTREELIGQKMFDVFPDVSGSKARVLECIRSAVKNKEICKSEILRYDIPIGNNTYTTKYWTLDFSPIIGDSGEVEYVTQLSTDITNLIDLGFKP